MPSDWYSPALELAAALAWPAVVLVLLVVFRRNVGRFIDEVSEFSGFGASAKRQGNRRSADLQAATREELVDGDPIGEPDVEEPAVEEPAVNDVPGEPIEERGSAGAGGSLPTPADSVAFVRFYRRFALSRVRAYRTNADTSSARLAAEIVRSAYVALRTDIRIVAFLLGGPTVTASRTAGRLVPPQTTLARVDAPGALIALVLEARALALAVEEGSTKIDGRGALAFVDAVEQITRELFDWAEGAV